MKRSSYGERDYTFGQTMLTLRATLGLTQAELADFLGISRRAVGEWEAGSSYPKAHHLKQFITLAVQQRAFPPGREAEEIRALWQAAHQRVLLDENWLAALLGSSLPPPAPVTTPPVASLPVSPSVPARSISGPRVDWGDALAVPNFYGREQELATLSRWLVEERCRVVSVLGMGGMGKSALVVHAMHHLATHFEVVIFRSLRNTPPCELLLEECLQVLAPDPLVQVPQSLERSLDLLLDYLHTRRVLLVLDNLESLLEEGTVRGRLHSDFEGYGRLLRRVAETAHQSCLLLTSREKPTELRALEGSRTPVRSLRLAGLDAASCEYLLAENELTGLPEERARLVEIYEGNPLALKMVAETIADLFGGEIGQFLWEGTIIFGSITDLLEEQFARLSSLEQTVLCWLATRREPVTLEELLALLIAPLPRVQVLEALDGLRRRSLIERGQRPGSFTLQSVVLEYVTGKLVRQVSQEIQQGGWRWLLSHGLMQATAREDVRQAQQRVLLTPLLEELQSVYQGRAEVEVQLREVVEDLRERTEDAQGYGPANLLALLRLVRGNLRGLDLSYLSIRGAYLQGVEMQDTNLSGALIRDSLFTQAFDASWAVAISGSGEYWAAGSRRGEVWVWREGGQILHLAWQAHTDNTYTLAFSPDGQTLASGSWDGAVKLWDLEHGALLWTGWHTDLVRDVVFSPDGSILASGGADGAVHLWNATTGAKIQTLSHPGPVFSFTWSPAGRLLASGNFDGDIWLWQLQGSHAATRIAVLNGHTNWVFALAFSPDGTQLVSGSWDGTTRIWDVESRCLRETLTGHTERIYDVAWSPDGRTVASTGLDKTIWLWDVQRGNYRVPLQGHTAAVYALAFAPDSRSLLSGSEDGTLRVWDVASGQCTRIIEGYMVSLYDLAWSPDGARLACGGSDMQVIIWDVTGNERSKVLRGHSWTVFGVAWSPDGLLLASSGRDNAIRLWNPATGSCIQILRDPDYVDTLFYGVAWSPDGRLLACGSYTRGVHVWDTTTWTRSWVGRTHPTRIRRVAWSPDGSRLACCGDDGSVYLWETSTGRQLERLQRHSSVVVSLAWSPDGTRLASGGGGRDGGELFVWDARSGELIQTLGRHSASIFAVAWNRLGDRLISGGSDGRLRWWEVQSGECLKTREGHDGAVHSLRIGPDGDILASSGDDNAIRLWDSESAELLRTLRRDRPYERLNITGIRGLTDAQKLTLQALGAIEEA